MRCDDDRMSFVANESFRENLSAIKASGNEVLTKTVGSLVNRLFHVSSSRTLVNLILEFHVCVYVSSENTL